MLVSTQPRFEVRGKKRPRVWLLCNTCGKRIQRLNPEDRVRVDQAHFCERHDPGWLVDNSPVPLDTTESVDSAEDDELYR